MRAETRGETETAHLDKQGLLITERDQRRTMVGQKSSSFAFASVSALLVAGSSAFVLPSLQVRVLDVGCCCPHASLPARALSCSSQLDTKPLYDFVQMSEVFRSRLVHPQALLCREHSTREAVRETAVVHV